ncbi:MULTISPECIES: cell division topological specificity factor MinE [unclassified Vibrio]|uniref:Cell division topological specificity factor n=1 Tax=Vibrio sp. HB236076 TaxID=3232307 RepID=A0AB39HAE9_9VIBR|nr:cell division topological specificity factor MinE [Vibrio sp. HB161653]MDP5253867.1 cell division topological specificity factor MinE [Vibrio sp. HB161653]
MSLLEFFRPAKKTTANLAKERLQIIVAERRSSDEPAPSYLPQLKEDILKVIAKYVDVDPSMVDLTFEQKDDDISVLELNVKLPEDEKSS